MRRGFLAIAMMLSLASGSAFAVKVGALQIARSLTLVALTAQFLGGAQADLTGNCDSQVGTLILPQICPLDDGQAAQFSVPACPVLECAPGGEMNLQLSAQTSPSVGSCCAECQCTGDPHCEAFDGTDRDLSFCDHRQNITGCPTSKTLCPTLSIPGVGTCTAGGLRNSKCVFTGVNGMDPQLDFYSFDGVTISKAVGDQGVISAVVMTDRQGNEAKFAGGMLSYAGNEFKIEALNANPDKEFLITDNSTQVQLWVVYLQRGKTINLLVRDVANRYGADGFCKTGVLGTDAMQPTVKRSSEMRALCYKGSPYVFPNLPANGSGGAIRRTSSFPNLPDSLGPCQSGELLQYQDESGSWITVKALPDGWSFPLFTVSSKDYPELFTRPVRVVQAFYNQSCGKICAPRPKTEWTLKFEANTGVCLNNRRL